MCVIHLHRRVFFTAQEKLFWAWVGKPPGGGWVCFSRCFAFLCWFVKSLLCLKFTIVGARNYKNRTAIDGRSALDLRAEVGVWCMGGVRPFDEKMLLSWSDRSFQTNCKFAVIINCVARHANGATRALRVLRALVQIQRVFIARGNTT
jgi:hypothetical protein